jgi:hypothetical protein
MSVESLNISRRDGLRRRHWLAWIALCVALALHVADEALTDFLGFYNPVVMSMREKHPWLPLPLFVFETWLAWLVFAVVSLVGASCFVWRGRWAMRPISHVFAGFMLLNGLLHIAGSIYLGYPMPGVYTSPLLIAASVLLITSTRAYSSNKEA